LVVNGLLKVRNLVLKILDCFVFLLHSENSSSFRTCYDLLLRADLFIFSLKFRFKVIYLILEILLSLFKAFYFFCQVSYLL